MSVFAPWSRGEPEEPYLLLEMSRLSPTQAQQFHDDWDTLVRNSMVGLVLDPEDVGAMAAWAAFRVPTPVLRKPPNRACHQLWLARGWLREHETEASKLIQHLLLYLGYQKKGCPLPGALSRPRS
jgi:hypothetical protein